MAFCFFQPFSRNWPGHIPSFLPIRLRVHFGYVHVRPTKKTNLAPRIGSLDWWLAFSSYMFYRAFSVVQKVNFSSESDVSLFWGQLVRYIIFAITRRIMHRLGSFFNMMRISSSATNSIKGVCFCSAVFEKLARSGTPILTCWSRVPVHQSRVPVHHL